MLGGLVGCAADDNTAGTQNADNARSIGYYSNENVDRGNGNATRMEDNDGPLTEIMDRNTNEDKNSRIKDRNRADNRYKTNNRYGSNRRTIDSKQGNNNRDFGTLGNDQNGTNNRNVNRQSGNTYNTNNTNRGGFLGLFGNDNNNDNQDGATTHSKQDKNYHGHLDNDNNSKDTNDGPPRASAYNNNNNSGNLVQKIVDRVEKIDNVDDARAVAMGDNIIIAIDTQDNNDKNVGEKVRKEVKDITKGKDVRVVTDEATYTRVRDLDNNIRNGRGQDTIDADLGDLFENVGETLRRPFQTNNNR